MAGEGAVMSTDGIAFAVLFAGVIGLIVLFHGDPDLHDLWIQNLSIEACNE